MIEKHPFDAFVPKNARFLVLGSFTGKPADGYDWFYGSKRNQFWSILEEVYGVSLITINDKKNLFTKLRMAITDLILECEREKNSNLDMNLKNLVFNKEEISKILKNNKIEKIYFTSRFVENIFRRRFKNLISQYPNIKYITLPSPSPRFAAKKYLRKSLSIKDCFLILYFIKKDNDWLIMKTGEIHFLTSIGLNIFSVNLRITTPISFLSIFPCKS